MENEYGDGFELSSVYILGYLNMSIGRKTEIPSFVLGNGLQEFIELTVKNINQSNGNIIIECKDKKFKTNIKNVVERYTAETLRGNE